MAAINPSVWLTVSMCTDAGGDATTESSKHPLLLESLMKRIAQPCQRGIAPWGRTCTLGTTWLTWIVVHYQDLYILEEADRVDAEICTDWQAESERAVKSPFSWKPSISSPPPSGNALLRLFYHELLAADGKSNIFAVNANRKIY